jgi:hypothetical protein
LTPDGYVQIAILPTGQSPTSSTGWVTASLVSYPDTTNWQATLKLSGLDAGSYTIFAKQYQQSTNQYSSYTETTVNYA